MKPTIYTTDINESRILRSAVEVLLALPRTGPLRKEREERAAESARLGNALQALRAENNALESVVSGLRKSNAELLAQLALAERIHRRRAPRVSASVRRFTYAFAAVAIGAAGLVFAPDCRWPTAAGIASVALLGAGLLRLNDWCEEE